MGGTRTGALLARGMSGMDGPGSLNRQRGKKKSGFIGQTSKAGTIGPYCIYRYRTMSCESFRLPPESGNCSADKDLDLGIELDFSRRVQKRRAVRVVDSIPEPSKIQK
ncbi:hypothetical protein MGG_17138 [Pyricularia oryzae 70-15]|uniref:Uncharacterized protein n=4 Tax=Pyricularia TaxID=48558 RepID=A0ABQ8NJZ6_PYRGI|nr:uncharacterized protein MGG_17138 [Pyricularia oryzae 70-15]ELQ41627.1 hypothetical protein OOU_Y34scaffold00262g9 [Pyricularia oryzae Y34]KAI6285341.1 hypothetical protein MCOR26_001578 [Pyricularia oryzae]KAI6298296.1 hypothetical protein MCOR33_005574 [Pyricularia grisea]EHA50532.1 hypothetical protein MGG_17138 [Pyricularia oryzae 70-15]KAI6307944.1 hypothetical protein MCOR34_007395 [Pyricularia oryzae]